ncbi:ATP-binding protein [Streptacidiphilus sp. N1-3]|uniref:ATP-binding protein n=1 Tax=Streptacidiphilus alkalitolerans TaxID=3342712 RepID=A0ABV6WWW0_9ACTN
MNEHDRQYELHLTAEPRRLTVVRRIVAAHLRHWNLSELSDLTELGVTELLSNVHRHVGPGADCVLRLAYSDGCLRCEVHDGGAVLPRLLRPDDDEISGRGLALVAAISKEWGAEAEQTGKVVWFALRAVPAPEPAVAVEPAEPAVEAAEPAAVPVGGAADPERPLRLAWSADPVKLKEVEVLEPAAG